MGDGGAASGRRWGGKWVGASDFFFPIGLTKGVCGTSGEFEGVSGWEWVLPGKRG